MPPREQPCAAPMFASERARTTKKEDRAVPKAVTIEGCYKRPTGWAGSMALRVRRAAQATC